MTRGGLGKIVSGGQSGVDRGALDAAIELGVPHGGWCPRGRLAEDGLIPDRYALVETDSPEYAVRTERNVRDSDATLVLAIGTPSGGSALTERLAHARGKPCLVIDLREARAPEEVAGWLVEQGVAVLNVAGPRESSHPGIYDLARDYVGALLTLCAKSSAAHKLRESKLG